MNAVRWSPSGALFATGGADRKIKLWEVINGRLTFAACVQALITLNLNFHTIEIKI